MKKKIFILSVFVLLVGVVVIYHNYDKSNILDDTESKVIKKENTLSMMLETEAGSGKYEMTTRSDWPTDGYVFNSSLSRCENGGELAWDDTNKKVIMSGNMSDKCYVYFDKSPILLADYVKSLYTGIQGENGIFYHEGYVGDYEYRDAGDNSYRYLGENPNNYVCFGSEETICPENNLYRIIGVFNENNHGVEDQKLVKLIKSTVYGYYAWNTTETADWKTSSLNKILNSTFIREQLSGYENKISNVNWKISGFSINDKDGFVDYYYYEEVANATEVYNAKIGLMYASDYGYAIDYNYWDKIMTSSNVENNKKNWLYSDSEWIISPITDYSSEIGEISLGYIRKFRITEMSGVRPTFYLESSTIYKSGTGTQSDPIRLS